MMKRHLFEILAVSAAIICHSCAKDTSMPAEVNGEVRVKLSLEDTKASLIDTNLIGNDTRIHLDGYIAGSQEKHIDGNVHYKDGDWVFYTTLEEVHYYWPQKSRLDFMAYSPAKLDSTHISIQSSTTAKCTGLPMVDTLASFTKLKEFVAGYKENCSQSDGAVSINLRRPYAQVNFYLNEAVRSHLNYIKINGLRSTGTYNAKTSEWSDLSDAASLYCRVNARYPVNINNGSFLGGPFLVIPQELPVSGDDAIKMEFSYTSDGNSKSTITNTLIGKAYVGNEENKTTIDKWEAGKVYNYFITLNGSANEVRMAVKVSEWIVEGSSETEVK